MPKVTATKKKSAAASHIVKRRGHVEPYDIRKLYASVFCSCLSVRLPVGSAELVAEHVCKDIAKWLEGRHEVTSGDIRRVATQHLSVYNPDAAFVYEHHRDFM